MLIFGESDGLPGLIVDRFGDVVVVQTNTAGMERLQPCIFKALEVSLSPRAIILRNTSSLRSLEGLEPHTEVVMGSVTDAIEIEENGARFLMDPLGGQKTGWFFDHRDNRALLSAQVAGKRVLDLFSYTGAWAIPAALQGARSVDCVDASAQALELARQNAALNGVSDRVNVHPLDVFDFLKAARESRDHFDVIILDPPAFIKRKKD
ncbi:MAG: class I SAM-dependent rRNA methyltransferase, partial [Gammaproteobacteria bacterium]|nr:class I SAM-dependent rRNA methyltransferase [Gammaproteobacteria bacterium]